MYVYIHQNHLSTFKKMTTTIMQYAQYISIIYTHGYKEEIVRAQAAYQQCKVKGIMKLRWWTQKGFQFWVSLKKTSLPPLSKTFHLFIDLNRRKGKKRRHLCKSSLQSLLINGKDLRSAVVFLNTILSYAVEASAWGVGGGVRGAAVPASSWLPPLSVVDSSVDSRQITLMGVPLMVLVTILGWWGGCCCCCWLYGTGWWRGEGVRGVRTVAVPLKAAL